MNELCVKDSTLDFTTRITTQCSLKSDRITNSELNKNPKSYMYSTLHCSPNCIVSRSLCHRITYYLLALFASHKGPKTHCFTNQTKSFSEFEFESYIIRTSQKEYNSKCETVFCSPQNYIYVVCVFIVFIICMKQKQHNTKKTQHNIHIQLVLEANQKRRRVSQI